MAQQAQITSVDAIENFRAQLVVYLAKARAALDEVRDEVGRTRGWVQNDQGRFWENEARTRARQLERLRGELFNASLSPLAPATTLQQMAVQRAQRALEEAEAKLAVLRRWDRELENRTEPLAKQVDQLHGFLTTEMARAVAYLTQVVQTLDAYTGVGAPVTGGVVPPPAGEGEPA